MSEGTIIRFGRVTNVIDEHGGGRIQARTPFDNKIEKDADLPFYIPLLPKMFYVVPKVGETVLLLSMAPGEFNNFNFYIGPLISQEDKLYYEDADASLRITETGYIGWGINPRERRGVKPTLFPELNDIAIEGRKDTGIQLKDEEVRIKAGVKVVDDSGTKNNTKNPAFISLKYYPKNDYDMDGFKSTATIVADKINLIGTPAASKDYATKEIPVTENKDPNSTESDNLISDSAMRELVNKAHQVPYGDKLIEFLEILKTALAKHVHPFPTMAPCNDENMKAVSSYNLQDTLSDIVRIN